MLRALLNDVLFAACPFSQSLAFVFFFWPSTLTYEFFPSWFCFSPPVVPSLERSLSGAPVLCKPCFCYSPKYVYAPLVALIYCDVLISSVIPSLASHCHLLTLSCSPLDIGASFSAAGGPIRYVIRCGLWTPVIRYRIDIMPCLAYTHEDGHVLMHIFGMVCYN